jgi:hypothetical protein
MATKKKATLEPRVLYAGWGIPVSRDKIKEITPGVVLVNLPTKTLLIAEATFTVQVKRSKRFYVAQVPWEPTHNTVLDHCLRANKMRPGGYVYFGWLHIVGDSSFNYSLSGPIVAPETMAAYEQHYNADGSRKRTKARVQPP